MTWRNFIHALAPLKLLSGLLQPQWKDNRLSERQTWLQTFFRMNHKLLRSRRVVHKRGFTQLQGQRQRQSIIKYIRVLLINLNCDYSNSLNFFNCWRVYSRLRVYDPHKTPRSLGRFTSQPCRDDKEKLWYRVGCYQKEERWTGKWKMGRKQRIGNEFTDRARVQDTFCFNFSSSCCPF